MSTIPNRTKTEVTVDLDVDGLIAVIGPKLARVVDSTVKTAVAEALANHKVLPIAGSREADAVLEPAKPEENLWFIADDSVFDDLPVGSEVSLAQYWRRADSADFPRFVKEEDGWRGLTTGRLRRTLQHLTPGAYRVLLNPEILGDFEPYVAPPKVVSGQAAYSRAPEGTLLKRVSNVDPQYVGILKVGGRWYRVDEEEKLQVDHSGFLAMTWPREVIRWGAAK